MKLWNCTDGIAPFQSDDGDWFKKEDVKILVAKLRGLETKIARIEDGCNCEESYNDLKIYDRGGYWMCPAHGYKKL